MFLVSFCLILMFIIYRNEDLNGINEESKVPAEVTRSQLNEKLVQKSEQHDDSDTCFLTLGIPIGASIEIMDPS
jgi:hypothetical protein